MVENYEHSNCKQIPLASYEQESISTLPLTKEKAQSILDSVLLKIPELEREQKRQGLKSLLRKWQEEDTSLQDKHIPSS